MSQAMKAKIVTEGSYISFLKVGGRMVEVRVMHGDDEPTAEEVMKHIFEKLGATK